MKTSIHKPQFKTFLLLGILSFLSTAALATIEIQQTINPSGIDPCDGAIVVLAEGSAGPFRLEVSGTNGYQQTIYGVDGSYTLDELCPSSYTIEVFNNYSQQCVRMLEATLGCNPEHPFVKEVKIQATGQAAPYYHAVWEKNASGCYELNILEDNLPGFLTYGGLSNFYFEVKFSKAMSSADLQLDLSGLTAQNSPTYMLSSDGLSLTNTSGANFSFTDTWNPSYSIRLNVSGQDEDGKTLLDMRAMSDQLSSCVILPHENEDCDLPTKKKRSNFAYSMPWENW